MYTSIVERNNGFLKKTWIYPGTTLKRASQIEYGIMKQIVYAFAKDTDWQGLPSKRSWNSVQKKVNCQFF